MAGTTHLKQLAQSGATDGQVARWNNSSGQWVPGTATSVLSRQRQEGMIQTSPNAVIHVYGDGLANARGLTYDEGPRNMIKLRVCFRVDAGNNHDIRARLRKYDVGSGNTFTLAQINRSSSVNGNVASGTHYVLQQLVSAGANPSESLIESGDAVFLVIDRASGAVAQGVSQITYSFESEVI